MRNSEFLLSQSFATQNPAPSMREPYLALMYIIEKPSSQRKVARLAVTEGVRMSLNYNGKNIVLAKELRKNATKQENHLWYDFLSKYKVRFQRQKAIGNFIADFYCHKAKLIIEIDGSQHYSQEGLKYDNFRTERLEEYGLTVIRFANNQINENFQGVCTYIDLVVDRLLNNVN